MKRFILGFHRSHEEMIEGATGMGQPTDQIFRDFTGLFTKCSKIWEWRTLEGWHSLQETMHMPIAWLCLGL